MKTEMALKELIRIAGEMYRIEATASESNTGAGKRQDGAVFEHLMLEYWNAVADLCVSRGATARHVMVAKSSSKHYVELSAGKRRIVIPSQVSEAAVTAPWMKANLQVAFKSKDILSQYPDLASEVAKWAPDEGSYSGAKYKSLFEDKKTEFDDTFLKFDGDLLVEKVLLEYKTAKSSKGVALDGNAHERLTFQMMQYLEISPLYSKCSMMVFANGAFGRYKNKYHFHFRLQMHRLANFEGFNASFNSSASEYLLQANVLADWLLDGSSET
jgi:hypothetical protein